MSASTIPSNPYLSLYNRINRATTSNPKYNTLVNEIAELVGFIQIDEEEVSGKTVIPGEFQGTVIQKLETLKGEIVTNILKSNLEGQSGIPIEGRSPKDTRSIDSKTGKEVIIETNEEDIKEELIKENKKLVETIKQINKEKDTLNKQIREQRVNYLREKRENTEKIVEIINKITKRETKNIKIEILDKDNKNNEEIKLPIGGDTEPKSSTEDEIKRLIKIIEKLLKEVEELEERLGFAIDVIINLYKKIKYQLEEEDDSKYNSIEEEFERLEKAIGDEPIIKTNREAKTKLIQLENQRKQYAEERKERERIRNRDALEKLTEVQGKLEEAEKELEKVTTQLENKDQKNKARKKQIEKLELENTDLKAKLAQAENLNQLLDDENKALTKERDELRKTNHKLRTENDQLKAALAGNNNQQPTMAGLPIKLREEREEQKRIDDFNKAWLDNVEQWIIANSLPRGNEPNTNCDGSTPAGGDIPDENAPGITWQALRLRKRPNDDTNLGRVRVNAVRDGYELINATLTGQDLARMAGKVGRTNNTFDGPANDCKRALKIIELIATRFAGEAQIAWKSLQGNDRPRTWEDHQFDGAAAPIGLKSWIRRNFLSRVDTQLKYAEFTKIKMTYHYKNIQEYNVKYNNLKRQARQENMERRNAIDHYLNSLPHSIEIKVREWMATKETEGTEVPLEGDTNSVQANAIVIYSQLERVKGDLETKNSYKSTNYRKNYRVNEINESIEELVEKISNLEVDKERKEELIEKIERLELSGSTFPGKNGRNHIKMEIVDPNKEKFSFQEKGKYKPRYKPMNQENKRGYKILSEEILSEEEIEVSRGGIVSAKEKGRKYECKIIKKLEESGIQVIATKEQIEGTNIGDKGIDFMIQSANGMILGQIKDWNKKVGAEKVKEFITTVSKAPNNKGIIISSSGFTKSAYEEIKDIENIILAEEGEIIEKIQEISTIKIIQRKKKEENDEILELPLKTNNRYHVKIIIKGREFIGLVDSGAAKNAIRYQLAKELGLEIKPTEKRFGTAGTPAKVKGKSENRIKVGEEERESKETLYVIDSSGMTEIILGRTWLEDLGDHVIVDTYGTINKRNGNKIGKTIVTLYNSSMKTKAENINEIQEIYKEEKQNIYEITEEECIEALTDYFTPQGLMKIAGKEIIGFMLRTIDQKFDISRGITEKTARYIRKYLVGTVKQFISTQLKEYM
nr:9152_t:CDS:2 [Entrophospora candida]